MMIKKLWHRIEHMFGWQRGIIESLEDEACMLDLDALGVVNREEWRKRQCWAPKTEEWKPLFSEICPHLKHKRRKSQNDTKAHAKSHQEASSPTHPKLWEMDRGGILGPRQVGFTKSLCLLGASQRCRKEC